MTQPANRRLVTEDRFLPVKSTADAAYAAVTNSAALSPNYIINGALDIWQRATSFSLNGGSMSYTADRWMAWTGSGLAATVSRQTGPTGLRYCARIQRNSGNTATTDYNFSQPIETSNSIALAGGSVTLSFWMRAGANFSSAFVASGITSGTGTDQNLYVGFTGGASVGSSNVVPTTSWQRYTITGTVSSAATQLGITFKAFGGGTAGANDWFEVAGVQLEAGSVATSFRRNAPSTQAELAVCQRYFQKIAIGGIMGRANTATNCFMWAGLPVVMRATPSLSLGSSTSWLVAPGYDVYIPTAVTIDSGASSASGITCNVTAAGMTTGDKMYTSRYDNSIFCTAEL